MKTPDYSTFVVVGGSRGCGKTLDELVNAHKRNYQLESTISQLSKVLCGKENATLDELLQAVDQLKSCFAQAVRERDAAVYHLQLYARCKVCEHRGTNDGFCSFCVDANQFQWCGVCP